MLRLQILGVFLGSAAISALSPAASAQSVPGPVNNAHELLAETAQLRVHFGGRTPPYLGCQSDHVALTLVFKVADTEDVPGGYAYWDLLERTVLPVAAKRCRGVNEFKIGNYVEGYRLFAADGDDRRAKRVFMANEAPPPHARYESPIHSAEVTWNGFSMERRRMLRSDVWPDREDGASIAALRAFGEERSARETAAATPPDQWGYTHGVGFTLNDDVRAREANARAVLNGQGGTGAGDEAERVLRLATRRAGVESALATLSGWTRTRLSASPDFEGAGYDAAPLFHDVMEGEFASWLGAEPAVPNGLIDRAKGMYLDRVMSAYHYAYGRECRTDTSVPWLTYSYRIDAVTVDRLGIEQGRKVGDVIERPLRRPFYDAVVERIQNKRGGMGDVMSSLGSALRGGGTGPSFAGIADETAALLRRHKCGSDLVRQFEVNLYLLAEGYPPLQFLLQE